MQTYAELFLEEMVKVPAEIGLDLKHTYTVESYENRETYTVYFMKGLKTIIHFKVKLEYGSRKGSMFAYVQDNNGSFYHPDFNLDNYRQGFFLDQENSIYAAFDMMKRALDIHARYLV